MHYYERGEFGMTPTHFWFLWGSLRQGFWRVASYADFCKSGWGVMDDFGNLVEVK